MPNDLSYWLGVEEVQRAILTLADAAAGRAEAYNGIPSRPLAKGTGTRRRKVLLATWYTLPHYKLLYLKPPFWLEPKCLLLFHSITKLAFFPDADFVPLSLNDKKDFTLA